MNKIARLLENFEPTHYDVNFTLNEDKLSFMGSVSIVGKHHKGELKLHARDLDIKSVLVDGNAVKFDINKNLHELSITTDTQGNDVVVAIDFSGKIEANMTGIYPSSYVHQGVDKQILATQFEAHHAREALPCIDEPAAKATFQLTLNTIASSTVLSNTLPESESTKNDRKITVFKKTPKMSVYLLAFAAGEMQSLEATTKNGTLVRSFSSPAQPKENLKYSVNEAVNILEFFEEYFQTPYPLEKCDQIALPDFDAGAMENWGMITFREVALLTDPNNRSITSEQYVSLVVAHELSHQWFGNLVTMKWWDDLWLNESFASLMEHIALDSLHPDWQQSEHYAASDVISTTARDIYKDIQSVSVEVNDPELIETLFDPGIVYAKGGRLLKMLREYIGDDDFRSGLTNYFREFKYENATRDDLWKCLEKSSGRDIKSLMDEWLVKPGMPVVTVNAEQDSLRLSQQRFLLDGEDKKSLWPIPLLSSSSLSPNIFESESQEIDSDEKWPLINQHGSGHYFVRYNDQPHRQAILEGITDGKVRPEARINIINDMIMLSRGGYATLEDALTLIESMSNEPRYNVWAIMSRVIGSAQQLTEGDENTNRAIKKLKLKLANKLHADLGWDDNEGEDPNTIQLRSMMISFMLSGEDHTALEKVSKEVSSIDKLESLPSEHRASFLISMVKQNHPGLVEKLLKLYPDTDPEMQLDISVALASVKDSKAASQILQKAIGKGGFVRNQDTMRWIAYFLRNHRIRSVMWQMLVEEWDRLEDIFKKSKSFDFLPVYTSQVINTEAMAQKYRDLFTPMLDNPVLKRNITIGLSDIDARVAWRKREETTLIKWLSKHTE